MIVVVIESGKEGPAFEIDHSRFGTNRASGGFFRTGKRDPPIEYRYPRNIGQPLVHGDDCAV